MYVVQYNQYYTVGWRLRAIHTYISLSLYLYMSYISLSLSVCMYTYIHIYLCNISLSLSISIYIYIYIYYWAAAAGSAALGPSRAQIYRCVHRTNICSINTYISLPQIRRQRELPRTSEVCPYIVKDLILRTSEVFVPRG